VAGARLQPLPLLPGHPLAPRGGCSSRGRIAGSRDDEAWAADREEAAVAFGASHFVARGVERREGRGGEERCGKNDGEGLATLYVVRRRGRVVLEELWPGREAKRMKQASG
jgi:hypothetical protein